MFLEPCPTSNFVVAVGMLGFDTIMRGMPRRRTDAQNRDDLTRLINLFTHNVMEGIDQSGGEVWGVRGTTLYATFPGERSEVAFAAACAAVRRIDGVREASKQRDVGRLLYATAGRRVRGLLHRDHGPAGWGEPMAVGGSPSLPITDWWRGLGMSMGMGNGPGSAQGAGIQQGSITMAVHHRNGGVPPPFTRGPWVMSQQTLYREGGGGRGLLPLPNCGDAYKGGLAPVLNP